MTGDAWKWLGDGGGEAAGLIRCVDWAATAVGPVESWPPELKSIVSMMLYARQPMFLWWGPELIQFYNDGYTPSFGAGRHPAAMGQRGKQCWAEIWPIIGPEIAGVIAHRQGTYHEDALVEREHLVRELRAASRSKDEFVAMLGHELRNPLAPIATALSLLEMRKVEGIDRERAVIARQVRHLTRLHAPAKPASMATSSSRSTWRRSFAPSSSGRLGKRAGRGLVAAHSRHMYKPPKTFLAIAVVVIATRG